MKSHLLSCITLAAAALVPSSYADEIIDAIDEATASYKSGDFSNASAQLDYASSLVRQKKAAVVVALFPEALPGWTAEEAESDSAAGMFMGGGVSASRSYYRDDAGIDVNLVIDSPMLQSVMMMLSNPAFMTMSGGKLVKVQGNKAILQSEDDRHSLNVVVNGNALITIEGSGGATKDDVLAYAEKLNLKALE